MEGKNFFENAKDKVEDTLDDAKKKAGKVFRVILAGSMFGGAVAAHGEPTISQIDKEVLNASKNATQAVETQEVTREQIISKLGESSKRFLRINDSFEPENILLKQKLSYASTAGYLEFLRKDYEQDYGERVKEVLDTLRELSTDGLAFTEIGVDEWRLIYANPSLLLSTVMPMPEKTCQPNPKQIRYVEIMLAKAARQIKGDALGKLNNASDPYGAVQTVIMAETWPDIFAGLSEESEISNWKFSDFGFSDWCAYIEKNPNDLSEIASKIQVKK